MRIFFSNDIRRKFSPHILKKISAEEAQPNSAFAEVVELVDTHVSGACVRKDMGVRVPPSALLILDLRFLLKGELEKPCNSLFLARYSTS